MIQDSSFGQSSDFTLSRRSLCRSVGIGCAAIVIGDDISDGAEARQVETDAGRSVKKKGACGKGTKGDLVYAGWYYNWYWKPTPGKIDAEFVPMIKGKIDAIDKSFAKIEQLKESHGVTHLLGFNEPDNPQQGNTSVEKAIDLWPRLMNTGLRLGSPAVTDNAKGKAWFKAFAAKAKANELRIDFLAVHRYPNLRKRESVTQFLHSLDQLYKEYQLPIWITEFAGLNFGSKDRHMTPADNLQFIKRILPTLEQLPYVERYAWFSGDIATLYDGNRSNELGSLGKAYRRF